MHGLDIGLMRLANLWLVPAIYVTFSLFALTARLSNDRLWRPARVLAMTALVLAIVALLCTCLLGTSTLVVEPLVRLGSWETGSFSARADMIGHLFLVMVNLIGWIIIGFSHHYLQGEQGQRRYVVAMLLTLAAVNVVVIANNAAVLAVAWVFTSFFLHALLTFYPLRTEAIFAAHKKFIVSRCADVCLFIAIGLIAKETGSLELDQIQTGLAHLHALTPELQIAATLLAMTAILKCAQLPFHGWLIQVMEAPTPVSALLHAGVVNLGGFLLIRFSFLMSQSLLAQDLLVLIGGLTTVIAALVMMTRISIKVSLAWSTCAQMGFMLMQCGLGAYELAALHLLAHSLYKAFAFLNSGNTNARLSLMTGGPLVIPFSHRLASAGLGLAMVFGLFYLTGQPLSVDQPLSAFAVIVSLALAPLLTFKLDRAAWLANLKFVAIAASLVLIYLFLHHVFGDYLGLRVDDQAISLSNRVIWVMILFVGLYLLQSFVLSWPNHSVTQRLYPFFYGGFFLDDLFTRLTFWIWPAPVRFGPAGQRVYAIAPVSVKD